MAAGIVPGSLFGSLRLDFLQRVGGQEVGTEAFVVVGNGDKALGRGVTGALYAGQGCLQQYGSLCPRLSPRSNCAIISSYPGNGRSSARDGTSPGDDSTASGPTENFCRGWRAGQFLSLGLCKEFWVLTAG